MYHESRSAFFPLLLSPPVLTLLTAITYPEREGSDKLCSAVIGQPSDDTLDTDTRETERRRSCSILNEGPPTCGGTCSVLGFFLYMTQRPETTLAGLFRENNGLVLL